MFWRRKKKDEPSEDARASFVALSPDQVADALLGADSEDDAPEEQSESAAPPEAAQTGEKSQKPHQQESHEEEEEFYFEADSEGEQVAEPASPERDAPHVAVTQLLSGLSVSAPAKVAETESAEVKALEVKTVVPAEVAAPAAPEKPLPISNLDWKLEALRALETLDAAMVAEQLKEQWANDGLQLQEKEALRLARNAIVRVPLVLGDGKQEFWVFVYPQADAKSGAHFVAVERKANLFGAVAVYIAPTALELSGVEPARLTAPVRASLSVWPEDKPFPEGDYALWWPSRPGEHLANTEEGRLMTRIFVLQDEAASLLYGVLSEQLNWDRQEGMPLRRELPERTQYLRVQDEQGRPMILSAAQEKGVRLHLPRTADSEALRGHWLALTEQYLKLMVKLLLSAGQPLDTLWHDYETRPSQWWKAAQQVLDLRLEIGDNLAEIQVGNVAEERAAEA